MTKPDYTGIEGERAAFVEAWKIIERHRHTPPTKAHEAEWNNIAPECITLSQIANRYGDPARTLAKALAEALMDYYSKLLENY